MAGRGSLVLVLLSVAAYCFGMVACKILLFFSIVSFGYTFYGLMIVSVFLFFLFYFAISISYFSFFSFIL